MKKKDKQKKKKFNDLTSYFNPDMLDFDPSGSYTGVTDGMMIFDDGESIPFFKGDCIFVPATSEGFKIHGKAQLLDVRG